MYKKFASQVSLLIIVNLIIKLVWIFVVERKLQLTVGFENYGIYYSLFNFTLILSVLTDPGLSNYLVRSLASDNNFKSNGLLSLKFLLSFSFFLITIISAFFLGYKENYFPLLLMLTTYQILWSFLVYLRSYLKGLQFFKAEIFFSVLDKVLLILVLIPVLYLNLDIKADILFFAKIQILALIITNLICLIVLKKKLISVFNFKSYQPNLTLLKRVLPFSLFAFLVLGYNKVDVIMLDRLLPNGHKEVGIYAAAYRLLEASSMISILFASLFLPIISKLIKEKHNISFFVKESFEILMSLSLIISFGCWYYRSEIMMLLYGKESSEYLAQIFGVLMFCSPLVVFYYVYSTVLTANNNLKILSAISFMGLVLSIFLNLILIPKYGALGVSYSAFLTLLTVGIAFWLMYKIHFNASISWILIGKIVSFIILLIISGLLLKLLPINWLLNLILFVSMSFLYTNILGLISIKKITSIFKASKS